MNYARWATKEEMLKFLKEVDINSDIKKSGIPMGYDKNKLYIKDDNSHTIIIGAPGSGKTQGVMLPQIRLAIKAGESLFISDVKGEILDEIGGALKNNNYNIIVLDYANLEVKEDEKKFGIALVKEENDGKKDVITEKIIESHLSNNENLIDNLLKILVNYQVTPVAIGDIISDFKKCPELIFSMTK